MSKYIFITGGVLSSLGKGLTAAAIGALLENMGYRISFLKLDPYLNVDPGTMNPFQHGEVFVTHDGAETDLDLGHYERFTHVTLNKNNSVTAGRLYKELLEKERRGDFLGGTIQVVPHLTDAIKETITTAAHDLDCLIVEIGGTVGDIEGLPFIEAIRQMGLHAGRSDCVYIHLTYVPYLDTADELKTKPTQHSVKELCSLGVQPDILLCRSKSPLPEATKHKLSLFTNVEPHSIISAPDLANVYSLPLHLAEEELHTRIAHHVGLESRTPHLGHWQKITRKLDTSASKVTIAIVGKYVALKDAYKSLHEALIHAQVATEVSVEIAWIDAEQLNAETVSSLLNDVHGIIVPGGFGDRGVDGKICAITYARENVIPFLGICLGMQLAVVEFARSVLGLSNAHSTELDPHTQHPVVDMLADQKNERDKGGTMRLGAQRCTLDTASRSFQLYGTTEIYERHRHRYEFNPQFVPAFKASGMEVTGLYNDQLPEVVEIAQHPYFIGCQFHPELQSKPFKAHPLFIGLVKAAQAQLA